MNSLPRSPEKEKTITSRSHRSFPSVTKELLQKQDEFEDIHITLGDRIYRASLSKLYFDTLAEANDMIAFEQSEQFRLRCICSMRQN